LEAISGFKFEIDIVQNIIKDYTHLANGGKIINIRGSKRALTAAKSALFVARYKYEASST